MLQRLRHLTYRLLRKGERYTGTDNVYLAKSGFWLSAASAIASVSSFALSLLFARLVDKHAYGAYQYALSWGAILSTTALSGMSGAVMRAVAQGKEGTVRLAVRARLRWSLIGVAVAVAGGAYYLWNGRADLAGAVVILGVAMPIQSSFVSWIDYVVGKRRFDLQTGYAALETLGAAGALVTAMIFLPKAPALAAAYGLMHLGIAAYSYRAALRRLPPGPDLDEEAVAYGKRLTLVDLFSTLTSYVDRVIVFTFLGAAETAAYVFAIAPPEQLKGYLKNLYFIAFPKIAGRPIAEMRPGFFRKAFLMAAVTLAIAVAYALAAPFLYPILFPAYAESIPLTQVFALSLPATAALLPMALFAGHKLEKENAAYQVATSCVSIALLLVLTRRYGLAGTVAARVIGRYFGLLFSMALAARVFNRISRAAPPNRTPGYEAQERA